jgi:hypothetical protein
LKLSEQQERRILAVIGNEDVDHSEGLQKWYRHLVSQLTLPCEVSGVEHFQWEEFYVVGPGNKEEYRALQKTQPSYRDVFELTAIDKNSNSQWCTFPDDLKARVRRKSDGKKFILGLSELEATSEDSKNYQLIRDYAVWLANYR